MYSAVITWLATVRSDAVKLTVPFVVTGTSLARTVDPSLNVTVPSVTSVVPFFTVAVNVTESPKFEGFLLDATLVVVASRGLTVRIAVFTPAFNDAEMVTWVAEETEVVVMVKLALMAPAGTVTDAGTVAAAVLSDDSVTTVPPVGAESLKVTVPDEGLPPITAAGSRFKLETAPAVTVSFAVCEPL